MPLKILMIKPHILNLNLNLKPHIFKYLKILVRELQKGHLAVSHIHLTSKEKNTRARENVGTESEGLKCSSSVNFKMVLEINFICILLNHKINHAPALYLHVSCFLYKSLINRVMLLLIKDALN